MTGVHNSVYARPFLKWAGGKRWFARKYFPLFPRSFRNYYEPFLGSGAVFFSLKPRRGVLSDCNGDLIDTYRALQSNWRLVQRYLQAYDRQHSREFYYLIRASRPSSLFVKAARFIYLNRTCWNGLYRVNQNNEFNVPKGTKDRVVLETDDWGAVAAALKDFEVVQSDYLEVLDWTRKGDFVFLDPPYTIQTRQTFVRYNKQGFFWEDQLALCNAAADAVRRGVKVMVTHKANEKIKEMYEREGFNVRYISRASVIAANPNDRRRYDELLIRSWR